MARAWAGEGRGFGATVIGGAAGLRSKASWGRKARRCKPAGGRRQRGGIVVSAEEPLVIAGAVEDVKHLNRVGADAIDDDVAPVGSPADAGAARHRGMAVWRIRQLLAAIDNSWTKLAARAGLSCWMKSPISVRSARAAAVMKTLMHACA